MKIVRPLFRSVSSTLLTLFLVSFSLGQLQRVQLPNDMALYLHDIFLTSFVSWVLFTNTKIRTQLQKKATNFKKITQHFPLEVLWVVWILGSMALGMSLGTLTLKSLLYAGRLVFYILFVALVFLTRKKLFSISSMLLFMGMLSAVWGIVQYVALPDTRFLHIFGWDNHYYRLIGTLLDPAFMGMALVLTLGLWQRPTIVSSIPSKLRVLAQLIVVGAIAATFSRASYIALGIFLLLQFFKKIMTFRVIILMAAVFAATLLILPKPGGEGVNLGRTSTSEARLSNAQQNLITLHGAQWIWGRGLFNSDAQQDYETPNHAQLPDSLPVLLLNATGVGGTLLSLMVLWKWLRAWWKEKPVWSNLLVATLIHSLFNNTFLQPFVFLTLWLMF